MLTPEQKEEYLKIMYELSETFLLAVKNQSPKSQSEPARETASVIQTLNNTLEYYNQAFFIGTMLDNAYQVVFFRRGIISTRNIPQRSLDSFWKIFARHICHLQQQSARESSPKNTSVSLNNRIGTNLDIAFLTSPIDFFIGIIERDTLYYFLWSRGHTHISYSKRSLCEDMFMPGDISFMNAFSS